MLKEHICPYCKEKIFLQICVSDDLDKFLDNKYCKFCNLQFLYEDGKDWTREAKHKHISVCAHDENRRMFKKVGRPKK